MSRVTRTLVSTAFGAFVAGLAGVSPSAAAFTDVTSVYGIASGDSMSYGASFVDIDGDGDEDFYVNNHWKGPADFYRNDGTVPLSDFSGHFGTENSDRHDNLWGDFNNDGSPDHYIIHGKAQPNELWWNRGIGVLEEGALLSFTDDLGGRGREITLADFNLDGWLDIFIVNDVLAGSPKPSVLYLNTGEETFVKFPPFYALFNARTHVSSADYDLDGDPDLITTNPPYSPGELWRNEGTGFFSNVTASAFPGILNPLLQANGLSWADYDNDSDLDLFTASGNRAMWDYAGLEGDSLRWYVECAPAQTKRLHAITDGDSVTLYAGKSDYQPVALYVGTMGPVETTFPATFAVADIAGEPAELALDVEGTFLWTAPAAGGDSVFVVSTQATSAAQSYLVGGTLRANGSGILAWEKSGYGDRPGFSLADFTNRLYRNEGNGTFTEVTSTAFAVNDPAVSSLTGSWADFDNDGWLDLYVTNSGNVETGNVPNYLYRNEGDGTFTEIAAAEGVTGSTVGLGDGALWGDLNGDGFLDLFVDNGAEHPVFGTGPRQMFLNAPNENHWVKFKLRGLASNGSGVGAQLRIVIASGKRWRTMQGESDNCFANAQTLHFGLGSDAVVDTLHVVWPSGQTDIYANVAADATYWLVEGDSIRLQGTQKFELSAETLNANLNPNQITVWDSISAGNPGGGAIAWSSRAEDCGGGAVPWIWVSPTAGVLWPGRSVGLSITVDAGFLDPGMYCAYLIFESNDVNGPDTLTVNVNVLDPATEVPGHGLLPVSFALGVPRPNPTRGGTQVVLSVPTAGPVRATIHDVGGRLVAVLADGFLDAGRHTLEWSGLDSQGRFAPAGVYFLRVDAGPQHATRKIVRLD